MEGSKMNINRRAANLTLAAAIAIALAGCNQSISALETRSPPQPLPSTPLEPVESTQLDPANPGANQPYDPDRPYDPNQPPYGAERQNERDDRQIASTDQQTDAAPHELNTQSQEGQTQQNVARGGSESLSREALAGTWIVASDNPDCRIILAFTKWSGGYRAATRRCDSGELATVSAWDVRDNNVILVDSNGSEVASLYSSGSERYEGRTAGGNPISFTR
jgi:hypothetical protein